MELQPDEPEDVRQALNEVMFDVQATARIVESLAQQTDIYTPVLVHTMSAVAKALASDADRLRRVVAPALAAPPLAVKDGELERPVTGLIHTDAPAPDTSATASEPAAAELPANG